MSVHKHVHRHQTTKFYAHEMKWFHRLPLFFLYKKAYLDGVQVNEDIFKLFEQEETWRHALSAWYRVWKTTRLAVSIVGDYNTCL